ncbi:hypothetical protein CFT12S00416_07955 [Campylobacter fetus subsp. testudinum]|uniref:hypothetical protein n=1 Tax=Campylobacter fetus TaxID=196 RepID=UPI0008188B12|nr:hypothetical protein [Campylobacter fetus]OCR87751.1 hypothetical protein CFT12S00416_07955 [Campylobacter fetus subsp. testudinum]OCR99077.1 hypothetical protein A9K75_08500 [Campylobacter fetus subsp. testudinum]
MRLVKVSLFFIFACFFIVGCSGRVKTNKLPEQNKIYIPISKQFTSPKLEIPQRSIENFEYFVRKKLEVKEVTTTEIEKYLKGSK